MGDFSIVNSKNGFDHEHYDEYGTLVKTHSEFMVYFTFIVFVMAAVALFMIFMNFIIAVIS